MSSPSLCKIAVSPGKEYFLWTTPLDGGSDGFQLELSDGDSVWCGNVSADEMDDLSRKLKMDFNDFVEQTKKALTQENIGSLNMQYVLKKIGKDDVHLTWKKYIASDDVKIHLGSATLYRKPETSDFVKGVLTFSIDMISELQKRIKLLKADNERLSSERTSALKRLEKCVTAKEDLEKDLYEKFAVVINAKKSKICSMKNGTGSVPHPIASTSQRGTRKVARESRSPSIGQQDSEDEEVDTDEEKASANKKSNQGGVQTHAGTADSGALMLDDEINDNSDDVIATKRRRRAPAKKQTPSKPVLPKVSSKETDRTPRRSSMRKSGSTASNRSMENVDPDNLIGEMM